MNILKKEKLFKCHKTLTLLFSLCLTLFLLLSNLSWVSDWDSVEAFNTSIQLNLSSKLSVKSTISWKCVDWQAKKESIYNKQKNKAFNCYLIPFSFRINKCERKKGFFSSLLHNSLNTLRGNNLLMILFRGRLVDMYVNLGRKIRVAGKWR